MGVVELTNMSRLVHFIALAILLNAAPAFSQCATAVTTDEAATTSGFVVGSTSALSYAFKGQTAPANGIVCKGCAKYEAGATSGTAGDWFTVSDAAIGATAPAGKTGFFCPSGGAACTNVPAQTSTATVAGKFYVKDTIVKGVTATSTGVLCPEVAQAGDPANTCKVAVSGSTANFLGTACDGTTGACTAVIKGYEAPSNGVNCEGCVYKNVGETANAAGQFWTYAGELASGVASVNAGIFCPSDAGGCSTLNAATNAPSAGRYVSWTTVAVGNTATTAGVLCPTSLATGNVVAGGFSTPAVIKITGGSSGGAAATSVQGTALGYTNSAHKSTFSMLALIAPVFVVLKMVLCN